MRRILIICLLLFASIATAASLQWNASAVDEDHATPTGYRVHRGTAPGVYDWQTDVGLALQWPIPDDLYGSYYWAASAYNSAGSSGYSNEVFWQRAPPEPPQYVGATALTASRYQAEEQQMAVEKIVGDNTVGSNWDAVTVQALSGLQFTANWSGTATSVTCTTGKIYIGSWDAGTQLVKIFVYESDSDGGSLLATSSATTVTRDEWNTCTFSPGVTIVKGTTYRLAFAFANAVYLLIYYGSSSGSSPEYGESSNTYASPDDPWVTDYTGSGGNSLSIYLEADTAGGGTSAVPANRGNRGIMRGMSRSMWLDNDFLKPVGGN